MNETRDALEDRLQDYEARLGGLKSFVKELNDRAAEHGTDREHFAEDLLEAEHNVSFYESEVTRLRAEIKNLGGGGSKPGRKGTGLGPAIKSKKGVGALVVAALAGVLVAFGLKSRRGGKDKSGGR